MPEPTKPLEEASSSNNTAAAAVIAAADPEKEVEGAQLTDSPVQMAPKEPSVTAASGFATSSPAVEAAPPTASSTTAAPLHGDDVNPPDFHGEVQTNNELPTVETLRKIENYTVLDRSGKSVPFHSLYKGTNVARRVMIIFIRHFFCGVSAMASGPLLPPLPLRPFAPSPSFSFNPPMEQGR